MAIKQNIDDFKATNPIKRIGLVTFNSKVKLIGDGMNPTVTVDDESLNDRAKLDEIVKGFSKLTSISQSYDRLVEQLAK